PGRDRLRGGGGREELPEHRGCRRRPGERCRRRRRHGRRVARCIGGGDERADEPRERASVKWLIASQARRSKREAGGQVMDARQVIIQPVVSEKSYALMAEGKYTFRVHDRAHKLQVAQAIEEIFEVNVRSVRTAKVNSKPKRRGLHSGRS